MWKSRIMVQMHFLKSRNRDPDVENELFDTIVGGWEGISWEIGIDIYTLLCIEPSVQHRAENSTLCSVVT